MFFVLFSAVSMLASAAMNYRFLEVSAMEVR